MRMPITLKLNCWITFLVPLFNDFFWFNESPENFLGVTEDFMNENSGYERCAFCFKFQFLNFCCVEFFNICLMLHTQQMFTFFPGVKHERKKRKLSSIWPQILNKNHAIIEKCIKISNAGCMH